VCTLKKLPSTLAVTCASTVPIGDAGSRNRATTAGASARTLATTGTTSDEGGLSTSDCR